MHAWPRTLGFACRPSFAATRAPSAEWQLVHFATAIRGEPSSWHSAQASRAWFAISGPGDEAIAGVATTGGADGALPPPSTASTPMTTRQRTSQRHTSVRGAV